MQEIPREQVIRRLRAENRWWDPPHTVPESIAALGPRAYARPFQELISQTAVRRAPLLLGPRRVGKTVLVHHAIGALLASGVEPRRICYLSVDHPLYNGRSLEGLLAEYNAAAAVDYRTEPCFVFFDEIQYLREWEIHLKLLVDAESPSRFIASGSAAAALRLKSRESGAGRFTDFLLPPLTFSEYLALLGVTDVPRPAEGRRFPSVSSLADLNAHFVRYLNFGGYPEVALSPAIQTDPGRFIKSDIVDKVLLRDLPSLYGIADIQELNYLFTTLAYNTAQEVSLEELAKNSGVAKNTLRRYLEYLEAAFLIKIVHRLDHAGRRFQRATHFKVYLTNPSIRTALFSPIGDADPAMGAMAETGIFAQWFHSSHVLHYARWKRGEVDLVSLGEQQRPTWAVEVKWTDRYYERPGELKGVTSFCHKAGVADVAVTTRTAEGERDVDGVRVTFVPASVYCYTVGSNLVNLQGPPRRLFGARGDAAISVGE